MMEWPLMLWASMPRKPTALESITTLLLLFPYLISLLYRLYAKIKRRDGRSVGLEVLSNKSNDDHVKYEYVISLNLCDGSMSHILGSLLYMALGPIPSTPGLANPTRSLKPAILSRPFICSKICSWKTRDFQMREYSNLRTIQIGSLTLASSRLEISDFVSKNPSLSIENTVL